MSGVAGVPQWRRRLPLLLIALACIAPVLASYAAYYLFQRDARSNYGTLIARPAPALTATTADGQALTLAHHGGRWTLLVAAPGACDGACAEALYATRQARTVQGRERERVARVWLVTDAVAPAAALLAEHPDLEIAHAARGALAAWPRGADAIYLVDPLGNLVLAWPRSPDIKAMAGDITRLLRASQIG